MDCKLHRLHSTPAGAGGRLQHPVQGLPIPSSVRGLAGQEHCNKAFEWRRCCRAGLLLGTLLRHLHCCALQHRCCRKHHGRRGASVVCAAAAAPSSHMLAPLPPPSEVWAVVTGASSQLGRELAELCVQRGFGVFLADSVPSAILRQEAKKLGRLAGDMSRIATLSVDLSKVNSAEVIDTAARERGCDVALLLIASDQFAYTGPFLRQSLSNLDQMLAQNVGATAALCRLFGSRMLAAGRGRILMVGGATGTYGGLPGACAFAGSMAFIRALADALRQELVAHGVGVSCLESQGLGREQDLRDALLGTCVGFLYAVDAGGEGGVPLEQQPQQWSADVAMAEDEGPGATLKGVKARFAAFAKERGFEVLPFAAELDSFQRYGPAELSNALLTGFICTLFALTTLPGVPSQTLRAVEWCDGAASAVWTLDYLARWYTRGLKLDYLFTAPMVFDFISILPWLCRIFGVETAFYPLQLTFFKLLRVLRVYRLFRQESMQDVLQLSLGVEDDEAQRLAREVRPYQLQVLRTFGVVFTLLYITAGLLYQAEHTVNEDFQDFFSAFYFTVVALSTVGFGDIAPITGEGQAIISFSIIVALCVIPFQASAVAEAIAEEARLQKEKEKGAANAGEILELLARGQAQLAWDAARIAELEEQARPKRPTSE